MEQKTPFKDLSTKAKFQYIWDYYKFPILGVALGIIVVVSFIVHFVTYKKPVLTLTFVNCGVNTNDNTIPDSLAPFMSENGYDTSKYTIDLNKNLNLNMETPNASTSQDLTTLDVMIGAHSISAIFADADTFDALAERSYFVDISSYLSEDELAQYQDDLVYTTDSDTNKTYPVGVHLTSDTCSWLKDTQTYDDCVVGLCYEEGNDDTQKQFMHFLLEE